jgi:hypothetical protein
MHISETTNAPPFYQWRNQHDVAFGFITINALPQTINITRKSAGVLKWFTSSLVEC